MEYRSTAEAAAARMLDAHDRFHAEMARREAQRSWFTKLLWALFN